MSKSKNFHSTQPKKSRAYLQDNGEKESEQPTREFQQIDGSFQNFKRIIESTHDSVISLDLAGRVTYWSPSSEAMYGYKSEEVIGKSLRSFLVPDDKQKEFLKSARKIVEEGKNVRDFHTCRKTKDGRILDVLLNIFALSDENGKIIGSCGIAKDITRQLRDEQQVKKQHSVLQQAEELAEVGSWEYNLKTKEFLWSDGMFKLFRIPGGTTIHPSLYIENTIDDDRRIAEKIVQCIEHKAEAFEEVIRIKADGAIKIVKIKASPLKNAKGEVEKMVGVDMDITAAQRSEKTITDLNEELRLVNAELKNFTMIAANNYSETLRHLYIFLELIVTHDARNLSNSGRANLRRAQSAIQQLKLLTDDINKYLQLYDIGMHKAMIDPGRIIQSVLSSMSKKINEANATIELSSLAPLQADPLLFSILITNLVDNAIKFRKLVITPVIKIRASSADEINAVPGAARNTPYIIISISDNGIGFSEEDADKIFELFFQLSTKSSRKGSGIGLAVCKKIMDMHGGFITAEAQLAHGATFNCYFPARAEDWE
jgi:PAS domain S-box-containing protein